MRYYQGTGNSIVLGQTNLGLDKADSQTIYYWVEELSIGDFKVKILSAVSPKGLCVFSLRQTEGESGVGIPNDRKYYQDFIKKNIGSANIELKEEPNIKVLEQIKEYFQGTRKRFNVELDLRGTDFQLKVWRELLKIPYGETRSYSQIALHIACPKGQRAVGMANNRNPISIIVPCHRVIGKNGDLVGFGGGLNIKKTLLDLEKKCG